MSTQEKASSRLPKSNAVFNMAALIPVAFGIACVLFILYIFWWPLYPAYDPVRIKEHAVEYDGKTKSIRIHRFYCVNDTVPITINRDLIRIVGPNERELRITLPQTVQVYEQGCHAIDRIFDIPDSVPGGNYRLVNVATWRANPFRDGVAKLPELYIAIPPR